MVNYGYEGQVLLAVPVKVSQEFAAGAEVRLQADWLVCKEVCIPEAGEFSLRMPQGAQALNAAGFARAQASIPQARTEPVQANVQDGALVFEVDALPAAWQGKPLQAFPEEANVFDHAAQSDVSWRGASLSMRLPISEQRSESPTEMHVVLRPTDFGRDEPSVRVALRLHGAWPALDAQAGIATGATQAPALSSAPQAPTAVANSLLLALALAFGGGLLLNLMPCVFPVLSLKVMGLAKHGESPRMLRLGGVAYALGVVLSFVALAGLLLALRAGGDQLGWGFQLQSPEFVAALALLFTLIGLNLLGLFEVGGLLPGNLAASRAAHPVVDSALTGVLAVAVASPCTAPFMGAALGVALTLPAAQALAIFASLGLGMAAPYLAASWWPGLSRCLPRPGVWMLHFKVLMAFPMFATVIWLLWVLGQQAGIDGVAAMLGVLLSVALAAWVWATRDFGPRGRPILRGLSLLLCLATFVWAAPALREQPVEPASRVSAGSGAAQWQPWSPAAVEQALASGKPVFVDFTAAWCVTCQFNKRGALADPTVLADFGAQQVQLFRADWTRRDPQISQELSRLGRSGVPVYLLLRPGASPRLLPEVLTVAELRAALTP